MISLVCQMTNEDADLKIVPSGLLGVAGVPMTNPTSYDDTIVRAPLHVVMMQ
jgi:hypothetical protein